MEVEWSDLAITRLSTVKMAGSIELFRFVRKCHRIYGIDSCQLDQKHHSISSAKLIFLISCVLFMFSTAAFFLFEANSLFDYVFAFYSLVTIANCIVVYLIFIWQSQSTSEFIGKCERFIEKRKYTIAQVLIKQRGDSRL